MKAASMALILTLYGALGLLALGYLAGLVAMGFRGGGVPGALMRIGVAAAGFIAWLYVWRKATLALRDRFCGGGGLRDKR